MVTNKEPPGHLAALQKHKRRIRCAEWDRRVPLPHGLVAKPHIPKSKHHSYFEFKENLDKKKKAIEFEVTDKKKPSANFTFVPIGNPELTHACKELSREQGALIYIVSGRKEKDGTLGDHVHRIGYHFRTAIVEKAAVKIGDERWMTGTNQSDHHSGLNPNAIPDTQEEINKQADAAIRDLFPRVPNTDKEMIIQHAFQKGAVFNGKPVVGLQEDLTLSRRVQLAVIAHIRHTHTRYDLLLRETSWENARRAVESLCLDILVKWRGDEETGRDQLEEVLREVVVISDSEDDGDGDDLDDDEDDSEEEGDDEDSLDDIVGITSAASESPENRIIEPDPVARLLPNPLSFDMNRQGRNTYRQQKRKGVNGVMAKKKPEAVISSRTRSKATMELTGTMSETEPEAAISSRSLPKATIKRAKRASKAAKNARKGFRRYEAWKEAIDRQNRGFHDTNVPRKDEPELTAYNASQYNVEAPRLGFQRTVKKYVDEPSYPADRNSRQAQPSTVGLRSDVVSGLPSNFKPQQMLTRPLTQYATGQPAIIDGKPLLTNPRIDGASDYQRRAPQDSLSLPRFTPSHPNGHIPAHSSNSQREYFAEDRLSRISKRAPQDTPIPSVESGPDSTDGDGHPPGYRRVIQDSPRYVEVMYSRGQDVVRSRQIPARQDIVYVDGPTHPKRRRVLQEESQPRPSGPREFDRVVVDSRLPMERYSSAVAPYPARGDESREHYKISDVRYQDGDRIRFASQLQDSSRNGFEYDPSFLIYLSMMDLNRFMLEIINGLRRSNYQRFDVEPERQMLAKPMATSNQLGLASGRYPTPQGLEDRTLSYNFPSVPLPDVEHRRSHETGRGARFVGDSSLRSIPISHPQSASKITVVRHQYETTMPQPQRYAQDMLERQPSGQRMGMQEMYHRNDDDTIRYLSPQEQRVRESRDRPSRNAADFDLARYVQRAPRPDGVIVLD